MADLEERTGAEPSAPTPRKGKGLWAPTRGYVEIRAAAPGAARPAPAKKAAPKVEKAAAAAPTSGGAAPAAAAGDAPAVTAAKPAAPATATATRAAPEKPKEAAKKPAEAVKAAAVPKMDPLRDSVTTVPRLVEVPAAKNLGAQIYDEPDSETTLYRVGSLNFLFTVSSTLLLVYTVIVVWADYARPWKDIQADWNQDLAKKYEQDYQAERATQMKLLAELEPDMLRLLEQLSPGAAEAARLRVEALGPPGEPAWAEALLAEARRVLAKDEKFQEYVAFRETARKADVEFSLAEKALRALKGDFQAAKFRHEERKRHILEERGDTGEAERECREADEEFARTWVLKLERQDAHVEDLHVTLKEARKKLDDFVARHTLVSRPAAGAGEPVQITLPELETKLNEMDRKVISAAKNVQLVEANWRNFVRNMPFLDFLAPSYKIDKVVVNDLHEDLAFLTVPRVDRCKTCHINIDNPDPGVVGYRHKNWGSVYASHPRLDLFLGGTSAHPYEKFGCTVCHQGDGHATDFITAAHTPENEEQDKEWERDYAWEVLHHQDFPMFRQKYVTASCMQCHPDEGPLDGGGSYNVGYDIVRTYGCYGCHEIRAFQGFDKVGPNLTHIAEKADVSFLYKWIRNPTHFRPTTRMPRFFDLTNSRGTMIVQDQRGDKAEAYELDFNVRNGVEALAIATYVQTTSERRSDLRQLRAEGDPARGREVFLTSGCLGCHSVRRESMDRGHEQAEPSQLAGEASKVLDDALAAMAPGQAKPGVAEGVQAAKQALAALSRWYYSLAIGQNVEALYHDCAAAFEDLAKLDEGLAADGGPIARARAAAKSIYDRWIHNTFAPDLSAIGSKVKNPAWLADWIVDPRRHDPDTTMPRLRLEQNDRGEEDEAGEQRVADLVAYLQTLRDPEFEKAEVFPVESPEAQKVLYDIAFDYRRRQDTRAVAEEAIKAMSTSERLQFVGHRLIRRYGCFGCHDGIKDLDAKKEIVKDGVKQVVHETFDATAKIGTELNSWGVKAAAFLDYGHWGHQHSGREAIGHTRYDWALAKLTDTRRFDVIPAEKLVAADEYTYAPTNRLVQKTPEELLKMPLFAFAGDAEQVHGVVTFLAGLGKEVDGEPLGISRAKIRALEGDHKVLEQGRRLIEKLNCQGCHRIGAQGQAVHISRLPTFSLSGSSEEDNRRVELEKETWLAKTLHLKAEKELLPGVQLEKDQPPGLKLDKGTLLLRQVVDPTTTPGDQQGNSLSVVELAAGPVDPAVKVRGHFRAHGMPTAEWQLPVAGFEEGKIRFYFGTGPDQRPLAPPPLVREGERVISEWLFGFLLHVEPIRPWLKVKMPSFYLTQEEARRIVAWFKAATGVPGANELFPEHTLQRDLALKGKSLFGLTVGTVQGLQCNSCHPAGSKLPSLPVLDPAGKFEYRQFGFDPPDDSHYVVWQEPSGKFTLAKGFADRAAAQAWARQNVAAKPHAVGDPWTKISWGPDLGKAAARLRPSWIREWLLNPADFMPGTKMPNYFAERDPLEGIKYREPAAPEKIEALIQYLIHMQAIEGVARTAGGD